MKALTLTQPWADLLVLGEKTIECRTWATKYRGEFLIHASKKNDLGACEQFYDLGMLHDYMIGNILGAILGKAEIVDVITYADLKDFESDRVKHHALGYFLPEDFERGRAHGFVIKNPVLFEKKIPARGALNFWEYKAEIPN